MRFEQITAARVAVDQNDRQIVAAGTIAHVLSGRLKMRHLGHPRPFAMGCTAGCYSGNPSRPGGYKPWGIDLTTSWCRDSLGAGPIGSTAIGGELRGCC